MSTTSKQVLAFDIYGTLLDTSSISVAIAKHMKISPEKALELSLAWRSVQLQYTWRLNSMGKSVLVVAVS
jgi:2-haloacid dehalogenase